MKIHIVLYKREEFGTYKYNYIVIITIEEESRIMFIEFLKKKPVLKKKLTKNVIKYIKTEWVRYLIKRDLSGWKQVFNIKYEI